MADEITFTINATGFAELAQSAGGPVGRDLQRRAQRLRVLAVGQVGKDTGALASSIKVRMSPGPNGPIAIIGSDNSIALIHHNGTSPHPIAARPGRILRFSHRGKIVYAQKVMHPGTRPNRYLSDNLRRVVVD